MADAAQGWQHLYNSHLDARAEGRTASAAMAARFFIQAMGGGGAAGKEYAVRAAMALNTLKEYEAAGRLLEQMGLFIGALPPTPKRRREFASFMKRAAYMYLQAAKVKALALGPHHLVIEQLHLAAARVLLTDN